MDYREVEKLAEESDYYTLVAYVAYAVIEGDETLYEAMKWARETFGYADVDFEVALGGRLPLQLQCDVTQYVYSWSEAHRDR